MRCQEKERCLGKRKEGWGKCNKVIGKKKENNFEKSKKETKQRRQERYMCQWEIWNEANAKLRDTIKRYMFPTIIILLNSAEESSREVKVIRENIGKNVEWRRKRNTSIISNSVMVWYEGII